MRSDNETFRATARSCGLKTRFAWLPVRMVDGGWAWLQLVAYRMEPRLRPHRRGITTVYRRAYYGGARYTAFG